jgi:hypothetical protein
VGRGRHEVHERHSPSLREVHTAEQSGCNMVAALCDACELRQIQPSSRQPDREERRRGGWE